MRDRDRKPGRAPGSAVGSRRQGRADARSTKQGAGGAPSQRGRRASRSAEASRRSAEHGARETAGTVRRRNDEGSGEESRQRSGRTASPGADLAGESSGDAGRNDVLIGRNPVREAMRSGRPIEKLIVQKGSGATLRKLLESAREQGIVIETVEKPALDRIAGTISHQGICAVTTAHAYASVEDLFSAAEKADEEPFFILLDGVTDPQNLGAVIRTAECCGAHGVIIPKRRAAGLTAACAKASAGAVEYVPCARVTNLAQTIDRLKERGLWIFACDMDGSTYYETDLTGPCAVVIGAEGAGISRIVRGKCDAAVSIPLYGSISSLNASNAAAVLLYEIRRQRTIRKTK